MEEEKYVGIVDWFDPRLGYGFISRENEKDLFVHYSDIVTEGFKTLNKNQKVVYSIGLNNRKKIKAIEVVVISEGNE